MKSGYFSIASFLALFLCFSGCIISDGTNMPAKTGMTYDLETIALDERDIPYNVTVVERRYKQESEVSDLALNLGWQGGYTVRLDSAFDSDTGPMSMSQNIALYPEDRMQNIVDYVIKAETTNSSYKIVDLADPGIGDFGGAYAAYAVNGTTSSLSQQDEVKYVEIVFSKGSFFEVIRLTGPSADFATVRIFAKIALGKLCDSDLGKARCLNG